MANWPSLADRALRTALSAFGAPVTYRFAAGQEVVVTAIFDAAFEGVELDEAGVAVSTRRPVLGLRSNDLPAPPEQGDEVTVESTIYQIVDVRPDGQGGVRLFLHRA